MKGFLQAVLLSISCFLSFASAPNESKLDYTVTLADAAHHRVHVSMSYDPETAGNEVQLPVWNALYQVRDFAKNVLAIKATSQSGEPLGLRQVDKTTWEFSPRRGWVTLDYDIVLDEAGPFGAQFNPHHAFLNLAELLMYPVNGRELSIALRFEGVPPNWKVASALPVLNISVPDGNGSVGYVLHAGNYDRLVDNPCELGTFSETDFEQSGAKYRVVIDADTGDFDAPKLLDALKKITASETEWMKDRPFDSYLFIYHFPRGPAGGGMEHAYSTAIDHSADDLKDLKSVESVSAHEFFHLWNVKRIRPQSLEPIDYTRENYTRALWFSEGVTTTVADLALVKSGLLQASDYLERISGAITELENRPAHATQSAEESSLDTWLDKYPNYHAAERSISYYNKGDLLGILLDLKIRQDSKGRYSLRDLFREMNRDYANQGKFFPDSEGVRGQAEKLSGTDLTNFFAQYVAGTAELPYSELFSSVGLTVDKQSRSVADLGFNAGRNFTGPVIVEEVYGDNARLAGLQERDDIIALDGRQPTRGVERLVADATPGTKVRVTILSKGVRKDIDLTLGQRSVETYTLRESPTATQGQLARRRAWLNSEDQIPAGAR